MKGPSRRTALVRLARNTPLSVEPASSCVRLLFDDLRTPPPPTAPTPTILLPLGATAFFSLRDEVASPAVTMRSEGDEGPMNSSDGFKEALTCLASASASDTVGGRDERVLERRAERDRGVGTFDHLDRAARFGSPGTTAGREAPSAGPIDSWLGDRNARCSATRRRRTTRRHVELEGSCRGTLPRPPELTAAA